MPYHRTCEQFQVPHLVELTFRLRVRAGRKSHAGEHLTRQTCVEHAINRSRMIHCGRSNHSFARNAWKRQRNAANLRLSRLVGEKWWASGKHRLFLTVGWRSLRRDSHTAACELRGLRGQWSLRVSRETIRAASALSDFCILDRCRGCEAERGLWRV